MFKQVKQTECLSAILGTVIIIAFTVTAIFLTSGFDIVADYLSVLGTSGLGALLFNTGLIISGFLFIPFFIKLRRFLGNSVITNIGMFLGIVSCLTVVGVGLFPMTWSIHVVFGAAFATTAGLAILLFSIKMLSGKTRVYGIYGFIVLIISLFLFMSISVEFVQNIVILVLNLYMLHKEG